MARADLHVRLEVIRCCGAHPLLDLAGHGEEGLFDVAGILCRRLEEGDTQTIREFLRMSSQNIQISVRAF